MDTDERPPSSSSRPTLWRTLRNRVIAGVFVSLPVFITLLVIVWIYDTLVRRVIGGIAWLLLKIWYPEESVEVPGWIEYGLAPLAAIAVIIAFLFIAGMFFRSRLHRLMDWVLLNVPFVRTIYSAVRNVFNAIQRTQAENADFKRVVLVEFPHPGMKAPAFVTSECQDESTGQRILSVYVPTTPIPTSGYMLLVPAERVVELNWDLQETLQAIVSGGITVPELVRYYEERSVAIESTDPSEGAGSRPDDSE